jgi:excisionase family DNA binding protein
MSERANVQRADSGPLKPLTVTVATTKKITGLGNTTIWGLIKNGKLEVVRIGRRTLITYRSIEALLAPSKQNNV